MQVGVVFPHEISTSTATIRDYARAAEALGLAHIVISDHVILAAPESRPNLRPYYTTEHAFHEPLTLMGFLAAVTERLELATSILILPQRQTVLVAKQAAEVDVLSGGRVRLGVAVGWNALEYEALGEDFHTRGQRIEEQMRLMRALWSEHAINFRGRWHQIEAAGLNPLPVRRTIPIWLGGTADATLQRVARLADGWLPLLPPDDHARELVERLRGYIRDAGRDELAVGIEARVSIAESDDEADWKRTAESWRELGATHLSVSTGGAAQGSVDAHIERLRRAAQVLGV